MRAFTEQTWRRARSALDVVATVATVVVLGYVIFQVHHTRLVQDALVSSHAWQDAGANGVVAALPRLEYRRARSTVLVALSPQCHYCKESLPFYQRIIALGDRGVRVVFIFDEAQAGGYRAFLAESGVTPSEVKVVKFAQYGIQGTPTLVVVDDKGRLARSRVGRLSLQQEADVVSMLDSRPAPPATRFRRPIGCPAPLRRPGRAACSSFAGAGLARLATGR